MPDGVQRAQGTAWARARRAARQTLQRYLDASVPHRGLRWSLLIILALLFTARVVFYRGFYLVAYALAIHVLYFALPLVTPLSVPGDDDTYRGAGAALPSNATDTEFRPFVPVEPEFVVWRNIACTMCVCLLLTTCSVFDIPVYWPILVIYFVALFSVQVWARVRHMIRYRYVPWNAHKPKYVPRTRA